MQQAFDLNPSRTNESLKYANHYTRAHNVVDVPVWDLTNTKSNLSDYHKNQPQA